MAFYDDGDKSKRPEGSRNFPLNFPGPGEMRRAAELYYTTGTLWNVSYLDPPLETGQGSRSGAPYQAPDYQQPATQDFPAYGNASPWRDTTYPFARPKATGTPNPEYCSEDSISPKKPKVVLPPTQEERRLTGQFLANGQGRGHTRLPSYLPQYQDRCATQPSGFPPTFSPLTQNPNHSRPAPPVFHPRPWDRNVSTPPGFQSQSRDRPDSCPPGLNPQPQGRSDIRAAPGLTPQARNAAPVTFYSPPVWTQGNSGDPNFVPSRRQLIVDSPTFAHLYLPMQVRPEYIRRQRGAHQTPLQTAPSSPMGTFVSRQEERPQPTNKYERQRQLDEQAKGFDSEDDDAFYPHRD
ncbi:hypothetical protein F5Y06DRAFT_84679 [Hypoxylon sp. FL0890]|nr:hypothetical protein F5Y06DRAFT_84679 [Hypoxylon sp. FL0890]